MQYRPGIDPVFAGGVVLIAATDIAGVRTYGLIGLLGGGAALLTEYTGILTLGLTFVGIAGVLTAVYVVSLRRGDEDVGITSLIAALVTFVLGALAAMGEIAIAAASAVVTTLLLSYKPVLGMPGYIG